MRFILSFILLLFILIQSCTSLPEAVAYRSNGEEAQAFVCRPEGKGPFPAVVYSHGVIVDSIGYARAVQRGYDLRGICETLARDGYLTFMPIRPHDPATGEGRTPKEVYERRKKDLSRVIDQVKTMRDADPARIALMGHSMGGLLTLMLGVERKDLNALVVSAPAPGPPGIFREVLSQSGSFSAPVLLLVEAGEEEPRILENLAALEKALQAHSKPARLIRYDRGGGHRLFFTVNYYWEDVKVFLRRHLLGG